MNTRAGTSDGQRQLIVIVGPNRSGTTWLNQLLQAHREICGVDRGETRLFLSLDRIWRNICTGDESARHLAGTALAGPMRTFCDELLEGAQAVSARPNACFFVEKTPGTALLLPMVRYLYPDAWYIHIVRDGRDVVRSMQRRGYEVRNEMVNSYCWARQEHYAARFLAGLERVIHIRYEDLHSDPLGELLAVYERLGLSRYPGLVREIVNRSSEAVALYARESSVGTGKWRRDVTRRRLAVMYVGSGEQLVKYGYLDSRELAYWRRRPEYWLAVIRRELIKLGIASRRAVREFRIVGKPTD
jgi:Sulfotransferase family